MSDILIYNNFYQGTSQAAITDLTPPTFAGINFLDVESRGQIRAGWSAATDATSPIRYEIYIKASTSSGLFNTTNIIAVTPNLQYDIFTLPDGSFLQNGTTYYVGVRAIDGVSNRDSNTVSQSVISTGILTSIDIYDCDASWSIDNNNNFNITVWANKNNSLAVSPLAILGTASYELFDLDGNAIVGMSESGISVNSDGLFVFTPTNNLLSLENEHYQIKIVVNVDGENRTNFKQIHQNVHKYNLDGIFDLNNSNQIVGSFWATEDLKIKTTNLGSGSYQVYDSSGSILSGVTQTGISADVNGFYSITPFSLPVNIDMTKSYVIKISAVINGITYSNNVILGNEPIVYGCKATFSINSSNQLQATFSATKTNEFISGSLLGTASYIIYDKNGTAVVGLTESGISADVNGLFHITPVSASLLTDLTHFTAKITISIAGANRSFIKGFTLLGT